MPRRHTDDTLRIEIDYQMPQPSTGTGHHFKMEERRPARPHTVKAINSSTMQSEALGAADDVMAIVRARAERKQQMLE